MLWGTVVGGVLLAGGIVLGWLAFATPFVRILTPAVIRPSVEELAIGGLIWGIALVAPPCFAIVGLIRLVMVAGVATRRPDLGAVKRAAGALTDEYIVAPSLELPDGRRIRNVVVGPFGLAVLGEAPRAAVMRHRGNAWEIRGPDGRWTPSEHPVERTGRDGERLRRWIGAEERDFLVKVYAAYVTDDPTLARTPACAVIGPNEVAAWLTSLPPQRSLYETRRDDLVERIRSLA
jgi:hypothetical protein